MVFQDPPMLHQGPRKPDRNLGPALCSVGESGIPGGVAEQFAVVAVPVVIVIAVLVVLVVVVVVVVLLLLLLLLLLLATSYTKLAKNFCLAFSGPGVAWVDLGMP